MVCAPIPEHRCQLELFIRLLFVNHGIGNGRLPLPSPTPRVWLDHTHTPRSPLHPLPPSLPLPQSSLNNFSCRQPRGLEIRRFARLCPVSTARRVQPFPHRSPLSPPSFYTVWFVVVCNQLLSDAFFIPDHRSGDHTASRWQLDKSNPWNNVPRHRSPDRWVPDPATCSQIGFRVWADHSAIGTIRGWWRWPQQTISTTHFLAHRVRRFKKQRNLPDFDLG